LIKFVKIFLAKLYYTLFFYLFKRFWSGVRTSLLRNLRNLFLKKVLPVELTLK